MGWLKKAFKKVAAISNPVSAANLVGKQAFGSKFDAVSVATGGKLKSPTLKVAGMDIDLTAVAGAGSSILETKDSIEEYEANRQMQIEKKAEKKDLRSDQAEYDKFKNQALLDNVDTGLDLFNPTFKRNQKLASEASAMTSLFNQRKNEILNRRATPGVSQTRFS